MPPTSRCMQLGIGDGRSRWARAGSSDKNALEAGLQFLIAGGPGHGLDIGKRSRAKGKAAWTDKVQ